jgi:hypothetical protein
MAGADSPSRPTAAGAAQQGGFQPVGRETQSSDAELRWENAGQRAGRTLIHIANCWRDVVFLDH